VILELSDGSSAWLRGAAALLLAVHIGGATIGLLSGTAALLVRKGAHLHRLFGNVFFVSMLTMAAIGATVSPFLPRPQLGNVIGGTFTFYLVATAWLTVRRTEGSVGRFDTGAFLFALGMAVTMVILGLRAANDPARSPDDPPLVAYAVFGSTALLSAFSDFRMIRRGGVFGTQRIARHLSRMCGALLIAAVSFFLGQQQVFPAWIRGSTWLFVPEIVVLAFWGFWFVRVRFTKWFERDAADRGAAKAQARLRTEVPAAPARAAHS
jgi:hypothetical protein